MKDRLIKWVLPIIVAAVLCLIIGHYIDNGSVTGDRTLETADIQDTAVIPGEAAVNKFPASIAGWIREQAVNTLLPVLAFIDEEPTGEPETVLLLQAVSRKAPLYRYYNEQADIQLSREDDITGEMILEAEGSDEDRKDIDEDALEYGDSALHINGDLQKAMMEENGYHEDAPGEARQDGQNPEESAADPDSAQGVPFQKAQAKAYEYDWNTLTGYDEIVSGFYAVDNTTSITDSQLNLDNLLHKDMTLKASPDSPQILIYHTHSQESFADSAPGDPSTTIVGAGEELTRILRDEYGFNVLHHAGEYDVESRDYAYSNALPAIEQVLAQNPTIEVVIDLHRDAVKEGRKLAIDLQGRTTAQFMFFNGLSRTRKGGNIDYLENPYVNDNLAFSFQMQAACNEYYPGLARRIYLKAYRYNMHLRAKSLLIEMGAQTNTVEEIRNALDPLAHVIAMVLKGEAP